MISLILFIGLLTANAEEPVFYAGNDELRQYIQEANENNPELKARYHEWQAALQKIPQVTSLEDPMLSYTQFLQSDQKRFGVALEQKFPWFGTLRARGNKALAESEAVLARFYATRNQVIAEVKRIYFEYALLGETIRILQSQTGVFTDVEEIIKSRYSLGLATEADLYRVQIEKDKLTDMQKGLEQSRPALCARLQAALGRETGTEFPWPQAIDFPPAPPSADEVKSRIRTANPEIAAMQHVIEGWEKEKVLAKKRGYPEFILGLGYDNMKDLKMNTRKMNIASAADSVKMLIQDTPTMGVFPTLNNISYDAGKDQFLRQSDNVKDDVGVSLKLSLPIWRSRIKAGIKEAELMQKSAESEKQKITLNYDSAAQNALFGIQDAQRRMNLYKEVLIPKERKTYESLQTYYSAGTDPANPTDSGGTADYMDIQNSVRSLLEFQLEQARATRDLQIAFAELEVLMGGPWGSTEKQ